MKKIKSSLVIMIAASAVITMILTSFQVKKINVTGTWEMTVETTGGTGNPVFILKHVNDSILSGTYTGMLGEAPVKGTLNGDKIKLQFSIEDNLVVYSGTVTDNTMKGKVVLASYGEATFTGKRKVN